MRHAKKTNPASAGTEDGAKGLSRPDDFIPSSAKTEELSSGVTEHWLHVAFADGTEQIFPAEPADLPSLHIWSANGREYAITASQVWIEDRPGWVTHGTRHIMERSPPGANWRRCNFKPAFLKPLLQARAPSQLWSRKAVRR